MTTLDKLHAIERMAIVHAILYGEAGVGFEFYEPGRVIPEEIVEAERLASGGHPPEPGGPGGAGPLTTNQVWRKNLVIQGYYVTFEAAVDAEYDRLIVGTDAGWQLIHTNGWEP